MLGEGYHYTVGFNQVGNGGGHALYQSRMTSIHFGALSV